MRMCGGAGCGRAIPDDVRWCDECKAERTTPADDGIKTNLVSDRVRYAHLYSSRRWNDRIRPLAIKRHPICSRCDLSLSEIVDHRVPAGVVIEQAQQSGRYPYDKWAGFFMLSNLHGLCRPCHAVKTEEDKAHVGAWPNAVDIEAATPKKVFRF